MTLLRFWTSATRFAALLTFWAVSSLACLTFALIIVAKLDVSFFEANGMIVNSELREAFYIQIFEIDQQLALTLLFGLSAVSVVSFIFANSQTNYFRRLGVLVNTLAATGEVQTANDMGIFTVYVERFLNVMSLRLKGEKEDTIKAVLTTASKDWPMEARISWFDQFQFAAGAGALAGLFSVLCLTIFNHLNERVIDLSKKLIHFTNISGPNFFYEQLKITNMVAIAILSVMTTAFVVIGFQHCRKMSLSTYSVLRDLRRFMEGNYRQRLLLRSGDLGKEYIPQINKALDKISNKLT